MDFDETRLYYSHQQLHANENDGGPHHHQQSQQNAASNNVESIDLPLDSMRRHFAEFLRNYRTTSFLYRDALLNSHRKNMTYITVDIAHIAEYDPSLSGYLLNHPSPTLAVFEQAAGDALKTILYDLNGQNNNNNNTQQQEQTQTALPTNNDIQILLQGNLKHTGLRQIKSEHLHNLLQCPGIVISTSPVRNRAVSLKIRCNKCTDTRILIDDGTGQFKFPRSCTDDCGKFPYAAIPDDSIFCDTQLLKLQEAPERVPTGEMPRSIQITLERNLVDTCSPGTRLSILCIPSLKLFGETKSILLKVVGLVRENDVHSHTFFTNAEETAFHSLSQRNDVYDILAHSIAPTIQGDYTHDIKRALVCQLFSGSRKDKADGVRLRGDINVLLLGDPSTAKSQFLKFIAKVASIGIYTSGKGSSAAGLTASVVKNSKGEFYLEGGAMVLADGGIVCIDEFDKMRSNDRVAIHEAMEQQTISIAKAGITTVLNARAAVLAAANPIFGRYDELKSATENIDLMTTILSRFDMIFLVRDIRQEERDRLIANHVMGVHMDSSNHVNMADAEEQGQQDTQAIAENVAKIAETGQGELSVDAMKKYIIYAKQKCTPCLGEEAGDVLTSSYVKMRDDVRRRDDEDAAIPITVRQLEALVRISESLAKMRLDDQVRAQDVTEALRLFRVSTMAANAATDQNPVSNANREELERTESFLRARLRLNVIVNRQRITEEAIAQGYNTMLVARALSIMTGRGELLERNQGRLLKRIK